jgi:hypothetical protein
VKDETGFLGTDGEKTQFGKLSRGSQRTARRFVTFDDFGNIAALVIGLGMNIICAWIIFGSGAEWIENSPFAYDWPRRRFGSNFNQPQKPAEFYKMLAWLIWIIEAVAIVGALVSGFSHK